LLTKRKANKEQVNLSKDQDEEIALKLQEVKITKDKPSKSGDKHNDKPPDTALFLTKGKGGKGNPKGKDSTKGKINGLIPPLNATNNGINKIKAKIPTTTNGINSLKGKVKTNGRMTTIEGKGLIPRHSGAISIKLLAILQTGVSTTQIELGDHKNRNGATTIKRTAILPRHAAKEMVRRYLNH
jgi:hypothetical protein